MCTAAYHKRVGLKCQFQLFMYFQSVWLASSYKLYAANTLVFLQFILPAIDHLRAEEWSGAKLNGLRLSVILGL